MGGSEKCPKSVTYYLNGPLHQMQCKNKLSRCAILEIVVVKMAYPCEPQLSDSITRFYKQFLEKLGKKYLPY